MKERSLYSDLIDGARTEGGLLYRIVDAAFTGKKPFDIMGVDKDGIAVAIEVKKAPVEMNPTKLLEDHQVNWLRAFAMRGARSFVILYTEQTKEYFLWKYTGDGRLEYLKKLNKRGSIVTGILK